MADRTCSIDGCEARHYARGWCKKHYARWDRTGSTDVTIIRDDAVARWWSKVVRGTGDACWDWIGTCAETAYGVRYGHFPDQGKLHQAHRFGYELLVGPIPEGMHLDHLCRNPPCVNPAHLEPVTPAENTRRGGQWDSRRRNLAARTRCANGHPLDAENRFSLARCRQCLRDAQRNAARRRRAVTEQCGYVSAYGRACQRQKGHEGRHHGQSFDYGETA